MITEAFVTKKIMDWLEENGWAIIAYDFPQSGTGYRLRSSNFMSKNKGTIIPDIVAQKEDMAYFFENKDRFFLGDFSKIAQLRESDEYLSSIETLFENKTPEKLYYGIGFPDTSHEIKNAVKYLTKIDFLVTVTSDGRASFKYNPLLLDV